MSMYPIGQIHIAQEQSRAIFPAANLISGSTAAKACADATTWKVGVEVEVSRHPFGG